MSWDEYGTSSEQYHQGNTKHGTVDETWLPELSLQFNELFVNYLLLQRQGRGHLWSSLENAFYTKQMNLSRWYYLQRNILHIQMYIWPDDHALGLACTQNLIPCPENPFGRKKPKYEATLGPSSCFLALGG